MKNIFLNKDGRLRTTLQIIIAAMTFLLISLVGQTVIGSTIFSLTESGVLPKVVMTNYFLSGILPEVLLNVVAGGCILLWYRMLNKKSLNTMGVAPITKNIKTILFGMGTFLVVLAVITGVLLLLGDIRFTGLQFHPSILQYILLMASVSFVEEVLNRGFIQHLVKSRSSLFWSCVIPSLVFMAFHMQNPGIKPLGLFNIFLAGMCFSVATQKVGNIWFAFGGHIVWNVGLACIFGLMSVSGTTGSILNFEYTRETIFNGFAESPLYGLIATVMWILLITLFAFKLKKSK